MALVSDGRSDEAHVRSVPKPPGERLLSSAGDSSAGDARPGRLML